MKIFFILAAVVLAILIVFYAVRIRRRRPRRLDLLLYFDNLKIEGQIMALTMTATQKATGELKPIDKKGNPAPVDEGSVNVSSSDEEIFVVERDPEDEKKFTIVAKSNGVAQLNYSADADMGDGVVPIEGFTAVEILPAQAIGFGIAFSEPVEQDAE